MLDMSAVQLKTAIIEAVTDLIYHSTSFLLTNREGKRGKSVWNWKMHAYFATVENKFCCSEHLSTDFQPSLTELRRSLNPGAEASVLPWKKVHDHEEFLRRAKRLQTRCEAASEYAKAEVSTHQNKEQQDEIRDCSNEQNDSVIFGSPTLEEWILPC